MESKVLLQGQHSAAETAYDKLDTVALSYRSHFSDMSEGSRTTWRNARSAAGKVQSRGRLSRHHAGAVDVDGWVRSENETIGGKGT
jgi:hypothetical protein